MKNDVVFANALNFRCLFLALLVIYTNGCQLDCRKNLHIYQVDCNFKNKLFFLLNCKNVFMKKGEKLGDMLSSRFFPNDVVFRDSEQNHVLQTNLYWVYFITMN